MAKNKGEKLKRPRTVDEIRGLEDKLGEITKVLQEIRKLMTTHGRPTVDLKTGTFVHHIDEAHGIALLFRGQAEREVTKKAAAKVSADLEDNPPPRPKKR